MLLSATGVMNVIGAVISRKEITKMKHFTIDTENNITVHTSHNDARATEVSVFASDVEFADLIGADNKRLVEIWNSLPGVKPLTKFASREVATKRIWKAIQCLGAPGASAAASKAGVSAIEADPTLADAPASGPDPDLAETKRPLEAATARHAAPIATVSAQEPHVAPRVGMPCKRFKSSPEGEPEPKGTRGSKTAQVIAMLQRKNGATLAEIMTTMGWQKHTVRGFMAGTMKKAGYAVESFRSEKGERTYRIKRSVEPIPQPTRRRRGRLSGLKPAAVWTSLESVPVLPPARNN